MRIIDIIVRKRNGCELTEQEIDYFVRGYTKEDIPDYQMSALLMAIYLKGMTPKETADLTIAMAKSGCMIDLSAVPGIKVDKHSTGGVADTTTLILAPLVAAAGVPVAKMSGRGLGFTGGTIDKLESIPGFQTTLSQDQFIANLKAHDLAVTGQSSDVAPADGKMYALRDVTATVESIPLIASSIMSKKIAAGADKIVLDVKSGSGAFMKKFDDAVKLAEAMVEIGKLVGRDTIAILTNMEQPLGQAIGNSLEVQEAIDVLSGRGAAELKEICLILGAHMLVLAQKSPDIVSGRQLLERLLFDGTALEKFREFICAQDGDGAIVENPSLLPQATHQFAVRCTTSGFVQSIDADQIGHSAMLLGAGREYKGQKIDLSAGIMLQCRVGDYVDTGQILAIVHVNREEKAEQAISLISAAIHIDSKKAAPLPLILGIVDGNGYKKYSEQH